MPESSAKTRPTSTKSLGTAHDRVLADRLEQLVGHVLGELALEAPGVAALHHAARDQQEGRWGRRSSSGSRAPGRRASSPTRSASSSRTSARRGPSPKPSGSSLTRPKSSSTMLAVAASRTGCPGCGSAWKKPAARIMRTKMRIRSCTTSRRVEARRLERRLVGHLDAGDELHHEHAPRRQLAVDRGHHDAVVVGEQRAHAVGAVAPRAGSRARSRCGW